MLAEDVTQSCDDPSYKTWRLLTGTAPLLVWVLGIPAAICVALALHKRY